MLVFADARVGLVSDSSALEVAASVFFAGRTCSRSISFAGSWSSIAGGVSVVSGWPDALNNFK
jgi:hypothetical protein